MYYLEQDRNDNPISYTLRKIPPHLTERTHRIFSSLPSTTYDLVPNSLLPSSVKHTTTVLTHQVKPPDKGTSIKKDSALTIHATEQGDSEPTPCIRFRTRHL